MWIAVISAIGLLATFIYLYVALDLEEESKDLAEHSKFLQMNSTLQKNKIVMKKVRMLNLRTILR